MDLEKFLAKVRACQMRTNDGRDVVEAACWFVALQEAEQIIDSWRLKDFANAILQGDRLAGPYATREHLTEWLNDLNEDQPEAKNWRWLDRALNQHFGIKGGSDATE